MPSSRTILTAGLLAATLASVVYWLLTLRWLTRYFSGSVAAHGEEPTEMERSFDCATPGFAHLRSARDDRGWDHETARGVVILSGVPDGPRRAGTESKDFSVIPDGEPPPVTFFRPVKRGVPRLMEKLEMLVRAVLPGDQIVLGADAGSAEFAIAEQTRAAFPQIDIAVVACAPGAAANPKISKLIQMQSAARHGHWIVSDSETQLDRTFCDAFREEWKRCDVLTAGYRITGLKSWPQQLDAAAVLLALWPGLMAVNRGGGPRFTLGACTAFRAADLAQVGGWSAFADDLAEDHQIGAALARAGKRIVLSTHVVALESDLLTWRDYWRHQRRVAVTYRVSNAAGFAGMALVYGLPWSLLLALLHRSNPLAWAWFALVWLARLRIASAAARQLRFPIGRLPLVVFIASLVEAICAALSWIDRRVWWGGWRRVSRSGKLKPSVSSSPSPSA